MRQRDRLTQDNEVFKFRVCSLNVVIDYKMSEVFSSKKFLPCCFKATPSYFNAVGASEFKPIPKALHRRWHDEDVTGIGVLSSDIIRSLNIDFQKGTTAFTEYASDLLLARTI